MARKSILTKKIQIVREVAAELSLDTSDAAIKKYIQAWFQTGTLSKSLQLTLTGFNTLKNAKFEMVIGNTGEISVTAYHLLKLSYVSCPFYITFSKIFLFDSKVGMLYKMYDNLEEFLNSECIEHQNSLLSRHKRVE